MATQDNSPGLFSKVAKFVRNPATDWAEVGKVDQADSGDQSKQSLKRMIERKAHNDAVRKREFSQLRKLRRAAPDKLADMAARTSFFKDSSVDSALDERAKTLKKIDDIEAQMSKQWWKGRPTSDATAPVAVPAGALPASLAVDSGFASTLASDLHDSSDDVLTQMGAHAEADVLSSGRDLNAAAGKAARGFDQTGSSAFSPSKVESIDMGLMLSDPVLEEAAIRFANSDDAGAEAVLQAALQNADVTPESADGWASALFDMYRGTGQQISFEWLAMDYERRFGRRCPVWFSTPQVLGLNLVPDGPPELPRTPGGQLHWICPADIDLAAVQQLQAQVVLAGGPYRLDWQAAKKIAPQAAQALASLFERWCDQPYTLSFEGVQPLERLLRAHTPVGENRTGAAFWWKLRLDTLRILRQQEDYEVVAMDYCVFTAPPSSACAARRRRACRSPLAATARSPWATSSSRARRARCASSTTARCWRALPAPRPMPSRCSSALRPSWKSTRATWTRAAIELTKDWRTDRVLRRLEAMLAVADAECLAHHHRQWRCAGARAGHRGHRLGRRLCHSAAKALLVNTDLSRRRS
jgi:hypothetical protein